MQSCERDIAEVERHRCARAGRSRWSSRSVWRWRSAPVRSPGARRPAAGPVEGDRRDPRSRPGCSAPTRSRRPGASWSGSSARPARRSSSRRSTRSKASRPIEVAVGHGRAVGHPRALHPDRPEGAEARGAGSRAVIREVLTDAHRRAIRDAFFEGSAARTSTRG